MIARPAMLATLLVAALTSGAAAADQWRVDHDNSRLGFTGTQQGGEFTGRFERFRADMRFSPDDLANSRFDVTIDIASITTGSSQRDRYLPDEEWFHAEEYPEATFVTGDIGRVDGESYEAEAELTIKGNTNTVTLPFTWTVEGDTATMDGDVTIDRTRYDVGTGEWSDGDTVGKEVAVHVELKLKRGED